MNREQYLLRLGVIKSHPDLEEITKNAYISSELQVYEDNLNDVGNRHRATSFFASNFPAGAKHCGRKAIYSLIDVPPKEPMSPFLRGIVEVGKSVEEQIVDRWIKAGIMLTGLDGDPKQIRFEDDETWLSGAADAVMDLRPKLDSVAPVDVKSKTSRILDEMIAGERSYDEKHYAQVQAYIYLCRKYHVEMGWEDLGLKPAKSGFIFYTSREEPTKTKQFYVEANDNLIDEAIVSLKDWKEHYLSGTLPERPKSWRWTFEPCKWCEFKKDVCKPDDKDGITDIQDSHAIEFSTNLRKDYDLEKTKEKVMNRWS